MGWGSAVERRVVFVRLAGAPDANISELCRRFEVSRSDGSKWLARYKAEGASGLEERSRRPHHSPARTPGAVEAQVLSVRLEHPAWGGRKIHWVLKAEGTERPPSPSTITEILRRSGRLDGPRAGQSRDWTRFEREALNELWQMDFKGDFALDQGRCHPLTVLDDHSRYALEIGACGDEQATTVQDRLTRIFRCYGLPQRILADNGSPWGASRSGEQHTRLAVWLMDLGIVLVLAKTASLEMLRKERAGPDGHPGPRGRSSDRRRLIPLGDELSKIAAGLFTRSGWLPELQVRRRGRMDEDERC